MIRIFFSKSVCTTLSLTLLLLTGSIGLVVAQDTKGRRGEVEETEIIIEKNREITLPEASRNFNKVPAPAKQPDIAPQKYQFLDQNPKISDLNTRFRILQMPTEPRKNLLGNYIKAGLGNYATLYGDVFLNSTQSEDFSYGLRFRHLSSGRGPVDKNNSATGETMIGVNGKYFTEALTASIGLEYDRRRYYFYGYAPGTEISDRDSIKQVFNTIALKTSFTSNLTDSPLDYRLDVNLFNLSDRYNAREFEVGGQLQLGYKITDNIKALLHTDVFLTRRSDSAAISRNLVRLKPAVQYRAEPLTVTAALNAVFENDTLSDNQVHLYPVVNAEYTFLENFTVFAGLGGDMQRTTLRQFVGENPYLAPNVPLAHTNKARELYGGLKGKLGQDLAFNTRLAYMGYKNLYFYVNSLQDTSKFTIEYNPDFTNVVQFTGELQYNYNDKLRLNLKADAYNYGGSNLEEAWHRPTFTTTVIGSYNLTNKIFFNTEIYYLGGIQAKRYVSDPLNTNGFEAVELDPIVDMNVKLDYLFFDKFSAFLSFNNLLSQKYQRYLNYPNRAFNVLIGATYTF